MIFLLFIFIYYYYFKLINIIFKSLNKKLSIPLMYLTFGPLRFIIFSTPSSPYIKFDMVLEYVNFCESIVQG